MKMRFVLLLPLLPLLLSCSSGDGPSDPSGDDPQLLDQALIGPAGGSLSGEGVTVTVEAGAFAAEAQLRLYRAEAPEESSVVTGAYLLEGIPAGGVLTLELEATGADETGSYVRVWNDDDATLLPAMLEQGILRAELAVTAGRSDEDVIAEFLGLSGYESYDYPETGEARFHVKVPAHRRADVDDFLEQLHGVLLQLDAAGFGYEGHDPQYGSFVDLRVMDVHWSPYEDADSPHGAVTFSADSRPFSVGDRSDGRWYLVGEGLEGSRIRDTEREAAGELMFMLAAIHLELQGNDLLRHYWLRPAAGRWGMIRFGPDGDELPPLEAEELLATLSGLYAASHIVLEPDAESFGLGMSEFFLWAGDEARWGMPWLARLFSEDEAPTPQNLILAFGDDASDLWWHPWVRELMGGQAGGLGDLPFVETAEETWSVDSEEDTLRVFSADYRDLSARWFNLRLDHDNFGEESFARFALESQELDTADLQVQVYKRLAGELTHLASGGEVFIEGLRELRSQGAHLLAAVSNAYYEHPYELSRGADLIVSIEEQPEAEVFSMTCVEVRLGNLDEYFHYEGDDCVDADHWATQLHEVFLEGGSWSGTTFNLLFDEHYGSQVCDYWDYGSLTVEMDETGQEVLSFDADLNQVATCPDGTLHFHWALSWSGGGLLLEPSGFWPATYQRIDADLDQHLTLVNEFWQEDVDCLRSSTAIRSDDFSVMILGFSWW